MKLLYFVPRFPAQTHAFFWREYTALREAGVEVNLVSSFKPSPESMKHAFAQEAASITEYIAPPAIPSAALVLATRPIHTLAALGYIIGLGQTSWRKRIVHLGTLLCAANLLSYARKHHADHIHVHSCADAAHIAALCRILGGPTYSLTLHGDLPIYGKDHHRKMKRASFVSCVTRALQRQVQEQMGLARGRLPVIWMGVDTDRFHDNGSRDGAGGRLRLVTVARLNAAKGHVHALAAMRRAVDLGCDIKYVIAGNGPHQPAIEAKVKELNLQDRVRLSGTISEDDVLALLQRSDAFVLSSVGLGEAAPVSVMEAMSCGLPVVCSIIGGTPDMITDGVDGLLIKQGDEEGLANAFVALSRDVELRKRIRAAARRRAVEAFDYRAMADHLLDAIRAAVSTKQSDSSSRRAEADDEESDFVEIHSA